jgi:ABC-2 type transport system ATP-binding protein
MSIVTVDSLSKTYRVHHKQPGLKGALTGLFKREYEDKQAINNLSFVIEENELVGFIGENGAGKTTTLKILSGLLYPSSGSARVLGFDPWERQYQFLTQISLVMGQKNQLWWDLPAQESFRLAKDIYGLSDRQYKRTLSQLIDMLGLGDKLDVQVRKLSLGERMKAELVAALLHSPRVLFLDEPTIGLDVVVQQKVRQFIKDYNQEFAGSILLTSHYMADVKELCQRVIIISQGRIVYDGLLAEVVKKFSTHKLIEVTLEDGTTQSVKVSRRRAAAKAQELLQDLPVADLNIKDPEIEDVIRSVFNKSQS